MTLVLALIVVLVILVIIDLFRKSLRIKQREILGNIERKGSEKLVNKAKSFSEFAHIEEVQREYPLLRDGFLLFYFDGMEPLKIKELATFLKYYGVKFTDDNVFQKINYKDVIFSILPDNQSREFDSPKEGSVNGIIAVMNYKKLASLDYDVKTCYELMMDILEALNKTYHGTLMNEHKIRLTKKDKQNYLEAIL